ncbi:MAG: hypothetical protein ACRYFK_04380 [Janthinobacterium lividum]
MTNNDIILRLQALGPLPGDSSPQLETFPLLELDSLLQQLTNPLSADHALALLNLGCPPGTSAYEVEWALVHAAESISASGLRCILPLAADTEVTRLVALRLANYDARQH